MAHTLNEVTLNAGNEVVEGVSVSINNTNTSAQVYYTLDGSDPMGNNGAIAANASLYNVSTGLVLPTGSYQITTRAFTTNNWGPKTNKKLAVIAASSGKLVISGINYKPKTTGDAEFLLLTNAGNAVLDLSGYSISDAITYTFPQGISLCINETLILVKDPALVPGYTYLQKYQWTKGSLANEGETITFLNPAKQEVDQVSYLPVAPWPTLANGGGYFLKLKDVNSDNSLPENWDVELIEEASQPVAKASPQNADYEKSAIDDDWRLLIYPNPVSTELKVSIQSNQQIKATAIIYALNGTLASKQHLDANETSINVASLPQGIYILHVIDEDTGIVKKARFIKK
jgi:hypothetical protein